MIDDAVDALEQGEPVVVYDGDGREAEADLIYPAAAVTWQDVAALRTDAGGLVCTAIPHGAAEAYGLPFMQDLLESQGTEPYGDRSSFSITVNHRSTYTGVTDRDRATTIAALADAVDTVAKGGPIDFESAFRSPGHVHVLRAHEDLLVGRRGHTELAVALMRETSHPDAAALAEMLDASTGEALSRTDARAHAEANDLVFLDGDRVDPKQF